MRNIRIRPIVYLALGGVVLWWIVSSSREKTKNSTIRLDNQASMTPEPFPNESIDHWKQRVGAQAGDRKDPNASLTVIAYPISTDGKCVSPVSGKLKWHSDHVVLVDWEFQNGNSFAEQITYAPYVAKAKGENIVFPRVELAKDGSSIPLDESLYWSPNRVLAQAAMAEGFELMDLTSIQDPDQEDEKSTFGARWANPSVLWMEGKSPSHQMIIPVRGQPKDACDDKFIDPWRNTWNKFMFPGALTVSKTPTRIDSITNSSDVDVESFYKSHFPRSHVQGSDLHNGRRTTIINLNEFDMTVWITEQKCPDCSKTSIEIVGALERAVREEEMKKALAQEAYGTNP